MVITELEVGGAERCLVRLACDLDRARFTPEVYSLAPPPQNTALLEQLEAHAVPVHFLGARGLPSFPPLIRRLRAHMRRQQPHVIQSFLFHANVAVSYLPKEPWRIVFGVRVADPRGWRSWLERRRSRRARRIVCVSQAVADDLRQRRGFAADKLCVIPNGVDVASFHRAAPMSLQHFGIADHDPVILFLGRLDPQKGIDWLLEAIQEVLHQHRSSHLVLAGTGDWLRYRPLVPEEYSRRIVWLGWQADPAPLLRRSALLVLPSRWEGMPNVVLEAMAAGAPVLATPVEGVNELLGSRAEEQTVDFGNTAEFARKALRLLTDEDLRRSLIAVNQARVQEHYSVARMVRAYEQLYMSLE